jgi:LmbE family N-acetylglucosaminyl deacetylase
VKWIYLSPHLDDVVLSCGGIIWEQRQVGQDVEIWTLCAGDPPRGKLSTYAVQLHARWGLLTDPTAARREEDKQACQILGVKCRHFDLPDIIYRRTFSGDYEVHSDDDLFRPLTPYDENLVPLLAGQLGMELPSNARLVSPMGVGGHSDHRLARAIAEKLPLELWYYPEFPYTVRHPEAIDRLLMPAWQLVVYEISTKGLADWQNSIAAYRSQISSFWQSESDMRVSLEAYWYANGGKKLWRANVK